MISDRRVYWPGNWEVSYMSPLKRVAALLLLFIMPMWAQETVLPEQRDWNLYIQTGTTNLEMKERAQEAIQLLHQRIDAVIAETSRNYDEQARSLLMQNQEAWTLAASTKSLFLADSYRGGTHESLAYGYAFIAEQIQRIADLEMMHAYRQKL